MDNQNNQGYDPNRGADSSSSPPSSQGSTPPSQPQSTPPGGYGGSSQPGQPSYTPPPSYPPQQSYGQGQSQYPPQQPGQYPPPQGQQYPQQPPTQQYPYPPQQYQQPIQYATSPKKGSSPLIWGLLGLLLAALIGGGVLLFFLLQPRNTTVTTSGSATSTPGRSGAATSTPGSSGPVSTSNAQLLKNAARNMRSLRSYSIDLNVATGGQNVAMKADLDIQGKRTRMDMNMGAMNAQIISIGDNAYMSTDGGQTFIDASANSASFTASLANFTGMWDRMTDSEIDRAGSALKDGSPATETIDGVATKHITGDVQALAALDSTTGGTASEGTIDLWITTDGTNYIRRMKINAVQGGEEANGTIDWSNFNQDFDIREP